MSVEKWVREYGTRPELADQPRAVKMIRDSLAMNEAGVTFDEQSLIWAERGVNDNLSDAIRREAIDIDTTNTAPACRIIGRTIIE